MLIIITKLDESLSRSVVCVAEPSGKRSEVLLLAFVRLVKPSPNGDHLATDVELDFLSLGQCVSESRPEPVSVSPVCVSLSPILHGGLQSFYNISLIIENVCFIPPNDWNHQHLVWEMFFQTSYRFSMFLEPSCLKVRSMCSLYLPTMQVPLPLVLSSLAFPTYQRDAYLVQNK